MKEKEKEKEILNKLFKCIENKDIITLIIDPMINFYKLQYIKEWEGNHNIEKTN